MSDFILNQLGVIRRQTIKYVSEVSDSAAEIIPAGLRNNIKWNLGHLYVVQERFAFELTNKETNFPSYFKELFDPGTKPTDWGPERPSMSQLIDLLSEQIVRIESAFSNNLKEEINPHYQSASTGLSFKTIEQLMSFSIYHEAMHFATIKNIKSIINN
ncbi:DinB family protein [Niallia taxi]|uniref:DinB family protein n=1 Tax=Niallia taxi TaxID=2499688 RepID=UPI0011A952B6